MSPGEEETSQQPPAFPLRRRGINGRIALLLASLAAVISLSAIATDWVSPRDRHPVAAATASEPAP